MLTAIAVLAISQTTIGYGPAPGRPQVQNPSYPEEAYLGGQLEIACGLRTHATVVLTQYIHRTSRPISDLTGYLDLNPRDALAKQPISVGHTATKVTNTVLEGKECILLESDARRSRIRQYRDSRSLDVVNITPIQRLRKVWLTPDGVPIRETSVYANHQGAWQIDAKFLKEEVEVTATSPKGKKTATLFPSGGMEMFANEFKPMVAGDKVVLPEKSFARLDPVSGGIVQITAKIGTPWQGSMFLKKFSGHRVDLSFGNRYEVAFVTKDMDLLQVNLPNGESLMMTSDPTEGRSGTIKIGGGG
jgi:hypothetical protein